MQSINRWSMVGLVWLVQCVIVLSQLASVESKPLLSELFHHLLGASGSRTTRAESSLSSEGLAEPANYTWPQLWLTVASVVEVDPSSVTAADDPTNTSVVRALELHWNAGPAGPKVGDYLELYALGAVTPRPVMRYLLRDDQGRVMPNYIKSKFEFPYLNQSQLDTLVQTSHFAPLQTAHGQISGRCLHYYVAYLNRDGHLQSLNCIQLRARWMEDEFALLKDRTPEEVMLPGTHDATSYERYKLSDYETNVITRFQYTQDETIYAQLAYGIRYLDMRVGAYNISANSNTTIAPNSPNTTEPLPDSGKVFHETLWMVHDIQRNHIDLRQALRQVKRFLERTTNELVIVDFHRFVNGFDQVDDLEALQNRLRHFYRIVVEQLGPFLARFSSYRQASIGDMVRDGKRVILGYAFKYDPRGLFDTDLFWPAVEHLWANTDHMPNLEKYMKDRICERRGNARHNSSPSQRGRGLQSDTHLQAAMAELTPSVEGILFLRYHGLRELAAMVNTHFDHWFRQRWWRCANIVAGDYFLGSDLVQIAIDVNRRRFHNQTTYDSNALV